MQLFALPHLRVTVLVIAVLLPEFRLPELSAATCAGSCGCTAEAQKSGTCCCRANANDTSQGKRKSCCGSQSEKTKNCCSVAAQVRTKSKEDPRESGISACPCGSSDEFRMVASMPRTSVSRISLLSPLGTVDQIDCADEAGISMHRDPPRRPPRSA